MNVQINAKQSAVSAVPLERAREHLRKLEELLRLFPKLKAMQSRGDGVYFCELEPLGTAGISHSVRYASRYSVDLEKGLVSWAPVAGEGNANIQGRCELTSEGAGTRVSLHIWGELHDLSVPLLARPLVGPYIKATFDGLVPLRNRTDGRLLVKSWFVIVPLLVYLPLHFQIMLLTGYSLPMSVLATVGLFDHVLPWLRGCASGSRLRRWLTEQRLTRAAPALLLLAVSVTNLYLLAWRVIDMSRHDYPFYLHRDEVLAFHWLEEHTPADEVVLSSFVVGHFIPGLTGDRAFLGSAVMTLEFNDKREMVATFFDSATSDGERQAFIRENGIRYVFYGPAEQALGDYDPGKSPLFVKVFSSPHACVYAVKQETY